MPFVQAVVFESLRLSFQLQVSLDRELHQDVTLGGYSLPKGALVIGNYYGVHFDESLFPDPFAFTPARFINAEGKFDTSLAGKIMTFGAGESAILLSLKFVFIVIRWCSQYKQTYTERSKGIAMTLLPESTLVDSGSRVMLNLFESV